MENRIDLIEKRLGELEHKVSNMDKVGAVTQEQIKQVLDISLELRSDIKLINNKPNLYWDKVIMCLIGAGATMFATLMFN
jgi:uncharacterized membrane protein